MIKKYFYICNDCKHEFYSNQEPNEFTENIPKCELCNSTNIFDLDKALIRCYKILKNKNYESLYCCSGHPHIFRKFINENKNLGIRHTFLYHTLRCYFIIKCKNKQHGNGIYNYFSHKFKKNNMFTVNLEYYKDELDSCYRIFIECSTGYIENELPKNLKINYDFYKIDSYSKTTKRQRYKLYTQMYISYFLKQRATFISIIESLPNNI